MKKKIIFNLIKFWLVSSFPNHIFITVQWIQTRIIGICKLQLCHIALEETQYKWGSILRRICSNVYTVQGRAWRAY